MTADDISVGDLLNIHGVAHLPFSADWARVRQTTLDGVVRRRTSSLPAATRNPALLLATGHRQTLNC
jgi:hypothetical protein